MSIYPSKFSISELFCQFSACQYCLLQHFYILRATQQVFIFQYLQTKYKRSNLTTFPRKEKNNALEGLCKSKLFCATRLENIKENHMFLFIKAFKTTYFIISHLHPKGNVDAGYKSVHKIINLHPNISMLEEYCIKLKILLQTFNQVCHSCIGAGMGSIIWSTAVLWLLQVLPELGCPAVKAVKPFSQRPAMRKVNFAYELKRSSSIEVPQPGAAKC